jgi:hypothetical protein
LLSTYYVSATGHDSASGTSSAYPWHTIARVNKQTLKAGDRVLFQGGKSFSGSLYLSSKEGGTASKQIIFSTYGTGRATINSGSKMGFDIAETGGIAISNLKFAGSGMKSNKTWGIYVHADWKNKVVSSFHFRSLEVSGYGKEGIRFIASGKGSAVNDVRVEYVDSHDNLWGGLKANSPPATSPAAGSSSKASTPARSRARSRTTTARTAKLPSASGQRWARTTRFSIARATTTRRATTRTAAGLISTGT